MDGVNVTGRMLTHPEVTCEAFNDRVEIGIDDAFNNELWIAIQVYGSALVEMVEQILAQRDVRDDETYRAMMRIRDRLGM